MVKNKVKIYIEVHTIRPGGGPPGYVYNLLQGYKRLSEIDKDIIEFISLSCESTNRTKSAFEVRRNIIQVLRSYIGKKSPLFLKRIRLFKSKKWKELSKCDIVIFHGFQNSLTIKEAHKITKTIYMPHCPTIAADEELMSNNLYGIKYTKKDYAQSIETERQLIKHADMVVFASKGAATEYWKYFEPELKHTQIEYIPSGIDLPEIAKENIYDDIKLSNIVLFAGRYVYHKGFDLFCSAAEYTNKINPEINFVSIGGGAIKPNNYVKDFGWQENPYPYIKNASLIVIPNQMAYYDLFPLECAALGKPIVMTKVGGNVDQLDELPDSLGCSTNVEELSRAIIRSFEILKENKEWGINNKKKYNEFFNSESLTLRWIVLLRKFYDEKNKK